MSDRFYGKYRAVVKDTNDPEKRGRIRVECISVLGAKRLSRWCLPNLPFGYFNIPPKNSLVWIEFENGDKNNPIWTGCFYTKEVFSQLFKDKYDPKNVMLRGYKDIYIKCPNFVNINNSNDSGKVDTGTLTVNKRKVMLE